MSISFFFYQTALNRDIMKSPNDMLKNGFFPSLLKFGLGVLPCVCACVCNFYFIAPFKIVLIYFWSFKIAF